jgi:hypothetical protein
MWSYYYREWPADLLDLAEPHYAGRRLDAGGFVLADPFDTILRNLSEPYLSQALQRALTIRDQYQLYATDLSWGWLHPGEANLPNILQDPPLHSPHHWIGWTSKELDKLYLDSRYEAIDEDLKNGYPALRCGVSWRSSKWRISPDDFTTALRLIEVYCTCEPSDWAPSIVLNGWTTRKPKAKRDLSEPWVKVALAIMHNDQRELDTALSEAQTVYTPLGYRIVVRGYGTYVYSDPSIDVHLPVEILDL